MKLSTLIDHLKNRLEKHRALTQQPRSNQGNEYYSNLQAQMTFRLFDEALAQLERYDAATEVDRKHVELLTDLLEFRWQELIKNTDEYYLIRINTPANLLCRDIAQYLAQNDLSNGRHANQLLMPTVNSWYNPRSKHNLQNQYWHTLQLTDEESDGIHRVIELGFVSPEFDDDGHMDLTCELDGKKMYLTDEERMRVEKHSALSQAYYADKIAQKKSGRASGRTEQERLLHAFNDEHFDRNVITATYGSAGLTQLKRNLLNHVNRLFKNRDQLIDFMYHDVPAANWGEFIETMNPAVFFQLMVSSENKTPEMMSEDPKVQLGRTIDAVVRMLDNDSDTPRKELMLFCLVCAYSQIRTSNESAFNSVPGIFAGYDRASKLAEVSKMKKLLTHQSPYDDSAMAQQYRNAGNGAQNEGLLGKIFLLIREHIPLRVDIAKIGVGRPGLSMSTGNE